MAIAEGSSHAGNAHVGVQPPCGREDAAHGFPQRRHGGTRPTDAGEEEQGDGHEDEEQDAVLAAVDKAAVEDGHVGAGKQVGYEEAEQRPEMRQLGKSEPARHADSHVESHEEEKQEVDQPLAEDDGKGVLVVARRRDDESPEALAAAPHRHADAQTEGLLQDEHQHGGYEEGGKASLGVVEFHFLEADGPACELLLAACRGGLVLVNLDIAVQLLRDVDDGQILYLVVEHGGEVAVEPHHGLAPPPQLAVELGGDAEDAEDLAAAHQLLRLGHRGAVVGDFHFGRGIHAADEVAAAVAQALVDHADGQLALRLGVVNHGIEQRVGQRQKYHEDEDALVLYNLTEFVPPDVEDGEMGFSHALYSLFRKASFKRKKNSCGRRTKPTSAATFAQA